MGWYLDGRVSAVVGTHTHVPTADARVLPGGTAYISDIGMTGPRDSIIGFSLETVLPRFTRHLPTRFQVADGPVSLQRGRDHRRSGHGAGQRHRAGAAPHRGVGAWPRSIYVYTRRASAAEPMTATVPPIIGDRRPDRLGQDRSGTGARAPVCRSRSSSPTRARCTAGMDIGTANPDAAARAAVPHHLLDLVDPDEPFTVARLGRAGAPADPGDRGTRPAPDAGRRHGPVCRGPAGRSRLRDPGLVAGATRASSPTGWTSRDSSRSPRELDAPTRRRPPRIDLPQPAPRAPRAGARRGRGSRARRRRRMPAASLLIGLSRPREVLYRRIDARARDCSPRAGCSTRCASLSRPAMARSWTR